MHWLGGITHRSCRENRLGEKTEMLVFAAVLMLRQAPGLTELPVELAYLSKSVLPFYLDCKVQPPRRCFTHCSGNFPMEVAPPDGQIGSVFWGQ